MQNDLGKALYDGEDTRVWIKIGTSEANKYEEIYNVLEFNPEYSTINKSFPLYGEATMKTINNQLNRFCTISFPDFDIGGSKKLREIMEAGSEDINNVSIKYYNGKTYRTFTCVPTNITSPCIMDKFNGMTVVLAITSDIVEEVEFNG
jgi:hypothetical protein